VDPTVIQPAAGTREPRAAVPAARTATNAPVVVGEIPALPPGFQPRRALMAQLNRARQTPTVVLTGPWGAGKTQLAAAYARARLADGWRLIAWVNARDSETLLAGLAAVAETAGLTVGGSRPGTAHAGQAVRHWLEADGSRRLLVFDGVEDPALLRPFVPAAGAARVLITAVREPKAELGTSVPVDVFSAEEALALLDGRTGLADEAGASAVAAELGHLPLALDQAAAVIAGQDLGYAAYLAKLRALPTADYLVWREDGEEQQPSSPGAAEAVVLSLEAASAADPLGVCTGVMEIVAMLSPAAVRRDLLRAAGQAGTLLGRGRRVVAPMVDQALERLNEHSLLGFILDGQAVGMHGLVARVARGWLARRGRLATVCQAAASALEGAAMALAEPQDHATVREILGQVTALLENAEASTDDADDKLARMLMRLRLLALDHLIELGDSTPRAIAIGEPLTADFERLLGASHPDTLNARGSLAASYADAGRVADAIRLFEQILAERERLLGPDDPDTMRSRSDLARAYREAGRVADAVPLVEQTLAARERLFGADHPSTLASRNNLARAYRATGRPAEAIPLFEKNVATCERLFGADHSKTLASRHNLDLARQESTRAENEGR
jgi:tetratricopeptide (TPR) repeat protein